MSMQIVYNGAHLLFGLPSRLLNPFALITVNFQFAMFQSKKKYAPLVLVQQIPNHYEDLMVS